MGWGGTYVADWTGGWAIASNSFHLFLYFAAHSYFASTRFKRRLKLSAEKKRQLFLALNFALVVLVWIYWAPLPRPFVWHVPAPFNVLFYALQGVGLAGIAWAYRQLDLSAFFGASRETQGLELRGPYSLCRHPSYFFGMLALASPYMPLGRFILAAGVVAYIVIGSRIEERKLATDFGEPYLRYRAQTPWLVPTPSSLRRALKTRS